jgi:hypothetical protein
MQSGATLIDIRADSQIARDGTIAGALEDLGGVAREG